MDESRCSPYPHYAWFAHWLTVHPPNVFDVFDSRHVTHRVVLTTHGDADVLWTTYGTEAGFHAGVGDIGFFPCDRKRHSFSMTSRHGYAAFAVYVPDDQLCRVTTSEGMRPFTDFRAIPVFRDALMAASLLRLSSKPMGRQVSEDIGDEIAARHVLLRLCVAAGCTQPDWQKDTSVFTPVVMRKVAETIDATLGVHVSLEHISRDVGLSPGHFARKFQQSSGLSLNRFMNRRRISMAFAMLKNESNSLSSIALELGFSSQSHFTRLFSQLTGVTPQRFRRMRACDAERRPVV